jgi:hypothetical protein
MDAFITKHADELQGTLSCFDRVLFRGHLPFFSGYAMASFLETRGIYRRDVKRFVVTQAYRLKDHARPMAAREGRPYQYFGERTKKEDLARQLAERDGIREGLVCVFAPRAGQWRGCLRPSPDEITFGGKWLRSRANDAPGGVDSIHAPGAARPARPRGVWARRVLSLFPALARDPAHDLQEPLDRFQPGQRLDHSLHVQRHVLVDQDVAESREALQLLDEVRRKPPVSNEIPHRLRIVLEAVASTGGEFARDIDHELTHGQERKQDVIVEGEVALEDLRARHPRPEVVEMIQVAPEFDEPLDEICQRRIASSLSRLIRRRKGTRSAARS